MPIVRKLLNVGDSRGISLPKSWLEWAEKEAGKKVVAVAIEVDRVLTIEPVFEGPVSDVQDKAIHQISGRP